MVEDTLGSARSGATDSLNRLPQLARVFLRTIMGHSEILKKEVSDQGLDDLDYNARRVLRRTRNVTAAGLLLLSKEWV